ncbi:hypothetical protein EDB83DRAFT_2317408 [Lactarius deliciosus]|nr:hypothetical protein EDB83DRAFT_2317408 [Lactarius deliciosus]
MPVLGGGCHTSAALSRTVQGFAGIERAILSVDLALHEISTTGHVDDSEGGPSPAPSPEPAFRAHHTCTSKGRRRVRGKAFKSGMRAHGMKALKRPWKNGKVMHNGGYSHEELVSRTQLVGGTDSTVLLLGLCTTHDVEEVAPELRILSGLRSTYAPQSCTLLRAEVSLVVWVINVVRGDWSGLTGYASVVSGTIGNSKLGPGKSRQLEKGYICSLESVEERGKGEGFPASARRIELAASESADVMVTDFTQAGNIVCDVEILARTDFGQSNFRFAFGTAKHLYDVDTLE